MKIIKVVLIVFLFFVGIGAVWGALSMFIDPMGITFGYDSFFNGFHKLPFYEILFTNLIFPGISLLIVNGITQITAAILLIKKHRFGVPASLICGCLLMAWITIQFVIFPFNWLSTAYFVFGAIEALLAVILFVKRRVA